MASTPAISPFSKAMSSALDRELKGVRVMDIATDKRPMKRIYEPGHPDADEEGYVSYPDIKRGGGDDQHDHRHAFV